MTQKPEPDPPSSSGRTLGFLKDKLEVPQDFDAPLPADVQASFEARRRARARQRGRTAKKAGQPRPQGALGTTV